MHIITAHANADRAADIYAGATGLPAVGHDLHVSQRLFLVQSWDDSCDRHCGPHCIRSWRILRSNIRRHGRSMALQHRQEVAVRAHGLVHYAVSVSHVVHPQYTAARYTIHPLFPITVPRSCVFVSYEILLRCLSNTTDVGGRRWTLFRGGVPGGHFGQHEWPQCAHCASGR